MADPEDKRASNALKLLFGPVEWAMRQAFSALVEDALFMDNIASGVLVGPKQLPDLHKMLLSSCRMLGLDTAPDLYIRQSPYPNAYTVAVQGRRPFVVCTSSLLDLLTPLEVQAVIAHELGHLKCEHSLAIAMANLVLSPLASISPVADAALQSRLLSWQRAAELSCDRAALLAVQDVRAVQSVTMKLCGGSKAYAGSMDVDAFVEQASPDGRMHLYMHLAVPHACGMCKPCPCTPTRSGPYRVHVHARVPMPVPMHHASARAGASAYARYMTKPVWSRRRPTTRSRKDHASEGWCASRSSATRRIRCPSTA